MGTAFSVVKRFLLAFSFFSVMEQKQQLNLNFFVKLNSCMLAIPQKYNFPSI